MNFRFPLSYIFIKVAGVIGVNHCEHKHQKKVRVQIKKAEVWGAGKEGWIKGVKDKREREREREEDVIISLE